MHKFRSKKLPGIGGGLSEESGNKIGGSGGYQTEPVREWGEED